MNVGDELLPAHVHIYHRRVPREQFISPQDSSVVDRLHAHLSSEHHLLPWRHADAAVVQTLYELLNN
jgi:hypothetical protein